MLFVSDILQSFFVSYRSNEAPFISSMSRLNFELPKAGKREEQRCTSGTPR